MEKKWTKNVETKKKRKKSQLQTPPKRKEPDRRLAPGPAGGTEHLPSRRLWGIAAPFIKKDAHWELPSPFGRYLRHRFAGRRAPVLLRFSFPGFHNRCTSVSRPRCRQSHLRWSQWPRGSSRNRTPIGPRWCFGATPDRERTRPPVPKKHVNAPHKY